MTSTTEAIIRDKILSSTGKNNNAVNETQIKIDTPPNSGVGFT